MTITLVAELLFHRGVEGDLPERSDVRLLAPSDVNLEGPLRLDRRVLLVRGAEAFLDEDRQRAHRRRLRVLPLPEFIDLRHDGGGLGGETVPVRFPLPEPLDRPGEDSRALRQELLLDEVVALVGIDVELKRDQTQALF